MTTMTELRLMLRQSTSQCGTMMITSFKIFFVKNMMFCAGREAENTSSVPSPKGQRSSGTRLIENVIFITVWLMFGDR
jgi:hypothetical protein